MESEVGSVGKENMFPKIVYKWNKSLVKLCNLPNTHKRRGVVSLTFRDDRRNASLRLMFASRADPRVSAALVQTPNVPPT
ncbi:hypothetical protein TNCV_4549721 [Trichonephila clavipes]|nr:hypothetical protein TNCV_4549721 [Trichonephila clavipes]